jgi:hypothetical protein
VAYALTDLARIVWKQNDLDRAVVLVEEALETARALDAARPRILATIILQTRCVIRAISHGPAPSSKQESRWPGN